MITDTAMMNTNSGEPYKDQSTHLYKISKLVFDNKSLF